MTEAEWLTVTDPTSMLEFLQGKVSERKLRLFGCGCCRRIWGLLRDPRSRSAIEQSERFADELASLSELMDANVKAQEAALALYPGAEGVPNSLAYAASVAVDASSVYAAQKTSVATMVAHASAYSQTEAEGREEYDQRSSEVSRSEERSLAYLAHDIFDNLFRPVTLNPAWLTTDVTTLAEGIYQERAFDRLPILADALQDAGCDNDDVLNHCRQPGEHVRGCWLVDLLAGRK